ncbi:FAD linked oxidase [Macleaya cordata]|uniref:FAD linked oxidase n=1 Tax=Macleaya cordata TaxID=56857 RepID=A0A200QFZ5_MACCD|nr:FAD linked oxidase [Macleaya cordata]
MGISSSTAILSLLSFLVLLFSTGSFGATSTTSTSFHDDFLQCLTAYQPNSNIPIPIYTPNNSSYSTIFRSSARNLRYLSPNSTKPQFVIAPTHESHVQAAVVCCRKHGLDIKVRSGGHDVEGQSYVSDAPFILVDLVDYRKVTVDLNDNTAWLQAGVSLGEVYYRISEKSKTLGFPAGLCPTVGVGGHISGGGVGALVRKYGLSADQVIDARIVNVDGKILDKETMGKDLYWAIRGGGAANFGVILSWKIKLVAVPPIVTVATIDRTLEQGATDLVHRWQFIADRLHDDLYLAIIFTVANGSQASREKTVKAQFTIMFLGRIDELLQLMNENFPDLGLKGNDCKEMSWVESHIYLIARGKPLEHLLDRDPINKSFLKIKTDYVKEPISKTGLQGIWKKFMEGEEPSMMWTPLGGVMNEISEFELPYPHRVGNIYNILYVANWRVERDSEKQIDWMRRFYRYMGPYVSKNPRAAYLNYKDLDLGQNKNGVINYSKAKMWGSKYFKGNFERLVKVKSMVDPDNFFKNKQSIPPIKSWGKH